MSASASTLSADGLRTADRATSFVPASLIPAPGAQPIDVPEHDIQSVALRFQPRSAQSVASVLAQVEAAPDFNTNTQGNITFRRVDPLRETKVTADERLQSRLELLCETLRAKY